MSYPVEEVPKEAHLFKYFPRSKYDQSGRPRVTAYLAVGNGMSTSWEKYCGAEECRSGLERSHAFGVVALHVECIEAEPNALRVRHSPRDWKDRPKQGRAHVDVLMANDDLEEQRKLYLLAVPLITPDPPKVSESEEKRAKKASHKKS